MNKIILKRPTSKTWLFWLNTALVMSAVIITFSLLFNIDDTILFSLLVIVLFVIVTCLYFIGYHIFASIAPDQVDRFRSYFLEQDIKRYFGFSLKRGYRIHDTWYSNRHFGNLGAQLESEDYKIRIEKDRGEFTISILPDKTNTRYQVSLEAMIYHLTQGKTFVYFDMNGVWSDKNLLESYANLLGQYLDQIAFYIRNNYVRSKEALINSQKEYDNLWGQEHAARKWK